MISPEIATLTAFARNDEVERDGKVRRHCEPAFFPVIAPRRFSSAIASLRSSLSLRTCGAGVAISGVVRGTLRIATVTTCPRDDGMALSLGLLHLFQNVVFDIVKSAVLPRFLAFFLCQRIDDVEIESFAWDAPAAFGL